MGVSVAVASPPKSKHAAFWNALVQIFREVHGRIPSKEGYHWMFMPTSGSHSDRI